MKSGVRLRVLLLNAQAYGFSLAFRFRSKYLPGWLCLAGSIRRRRRLRDPVRAPEGEEPEFGQRKPLQLTSCMAGQTGSLERGLGFWLQGSLSTQH